MPRMPRVDVGGIVYHVINRANSRVKIFESDADYVAFENVLTEAKERAGMRILSYNIMPNHWHFALYPKKDGDLSLFMGWLTMTHTQRWHVAHGTVGEGHLYQGRYKSFICQDDAYLLQLLIYIERNALRANLVRRAENWRWSSIWRREKGTFEQKKLLSPWPVDVPHDYLELLNTPQSEVEEEALRLAIKRGNPYGEKKWAERTIKEFGLETTVRSRGRPKKGS